MKCWFRHQYEGEDAPWIEGAIEISRSPNIVLLSGPQGGKRIYDPTIFTTGHMMQIDGYHCTSDRLFQVVAYDILFKKPKGAGR
jgi:hypothetical protein